MTAITHYKGSCPCGSDNDYAHCCSHYIDTDELPKHPEQLMRSRYTAYVLNNTEYLKKTWHELTRPNQLQLDSDANWLSLTIIDHQNNPQDDNEGWVEFVARYKNNAGVQSLHERSRFLRENNQWFYIDGHISQLPPMEKVSRNSPCPCGSGKKFKHCCID